MNSPFNGGSTMKGHILSTTNSALSKAKVQLKNKLSFDTMTP